MPFKALITLTSSRYCQHERHKELILIAITQKSLINHRSKQLCNEISRRFRPFVWSIKPSRTSHDAASCVHSNIVCTAPKHNFGYPITNIYDQVVVHFTFDIFDLDYNILRSYVNFQFWLWKITWIRDKLINHEEIVRIAEV